MKTRSELLPRERVEMAVLEAIAGEPSAHVMDLASAVEEHPVTIQQACERLNDNGYIQPVTNGCYTLTERGQRQLESDLE